MAIITISRQLGSLGTEIAKRLREELDFNYFDKEALEEELVEEYHVPKKRVEKYGEKKPPLWNMFSIEKERYFHCLNTRMYNFARKGDGIIVGMGGPALFKDVPGTLRVRVIASEQRRIERVQQEHNLTEQKAKHLIRHSDHDRAGFYQCFFHVDWNDSSLYDVLVNTDSVTIEDATRQIRDAIDTTGILHKRQETEEALAKLYVSHQIITSIVCKEQIPVRFLEVVPVDGTVILRGNTVTEQHLERCQEIARHTAGVQKVINEMHYVHNPYNIM
jgi:cytidylate kinase